MNSRNLHYAPQNIDASMRAFSLPITLMKFDALFEKVTITTKIFQFKTIDDYCIYFRLAPENIGHVNVSH